MASYSQIALSISDSETKTPNFSAYDVATISSMLFSTISEYDTPTFPNCCRKISS